MTRVLRALSFDLFDTLVDLAMGSLPEFAAGGRILRGTQALLHAALPAAARERWSLEEFVEHDAAVRASGLERDRELPTLERFARLCARLELTDPQLPARLTALHMEELFRRTSYHAHHAEVLRRLREELGLRIALCSNFSHTETAERVLREAKLHDCFDALVVSADVGWRKPRAEPFHAVSERLQIEPAATLHVGDRLSEDVGGARAAGMRSAWITRCVRDPQQALRAHSGSAPDLVIADLAELPERLQNAAPGR